MIRWHRLGGPAAACLLLLLSARDASAFHTHGAYTCSVDSTLDPFQLASRRGTSRSPAAGEVVIEVLGNQVEITRLEVAAGPLEAAGRAAGSLAITLDPASPASSTLRPLISSFEIPVGLLVTADDGGTPVSVAARFLGRDVAPGLAGTLNAELPPALPTLAGTRFSLELACRPAPIDVTLDKRRLCPGEDVVVEARAAGAEQIWIDGVPGARRVLEFTGAPGQRRILVTSRDAAGAYEHRVQAVELLDCGQRERFPVLLVNPSPYHPHQVEFLVDNARALGLSAAEFHWRFGDGTTQSTTVPFVTHSYVGRLPVEQEVVTFDAEVAIAVTDGSQHVTRKTVTLWNHYAFNRRRGTALLPTDIESPRLTASGGDWTGAFVLVNPESDPVVFDELEIELQPCDGQQDPVTLPATTVSVEIEPGQRLTFPVALPRQQVPSGACGVAVHLVGRGPQGLDAQADAYFDIPRLTGPGTPAAPEIAALIERLVDDGMVGDPDFVSFEELRRLGLEGRIPPLGDILAAADAALAPAPLPAVPSEDEEPAPGAECNPAAPGRPGLSCQATDEFAEKTPPRIANALKGDLLLHAECNFIGLVLRALTVPQKWTHEAIMTQNYFELRHHTATFDWFTDHLSDSGITFESDHLKYGWPGTLTMSVTDAFRGHSYEDPDGVNRRLSAINLAPSRCFKDIELAPPLVVKPHRDGYTPEVREGLKRAADLAKAFEGHYRFYGFTDGAIGLDDRLAAPDSITWAPGTSAAVSSTFIWTALHSAGVHLEGGLDDGPEDTVDKIEGARIDELTLDGQYFYSEAERRAGLTTLFEEVERLQRERKGTFGFFGQMSDQLANCFAADRCSSDDTDKGWQNPGVGRTTSPANFLFWDKPKYGGSYGLSEPLVLRDGGLRRIHRWTPTSGTGRVEITVVLEDGSPVQDARVVLMGLDHPTDNLGKTAFEAIPAGRYEVSASKLEPGRPDRYFSADCPPGKETCVVTVAAGATARLVVTLRPEPSHSRLVVFNGRIKAKDDEFFHDHKKEWILHEACAVRPEEREASWTFRRCVDDEVVAKLEVTCTLGADDLTVTVSGRAELHESTGCGDEREDHEDFLCDLAPGGDCDVEIHLKNGGFGGGDTADFEFNVVNGEGI